LRWVSLCTPLVLVGGVLLAALVAPQTLSWPSARIADHAMCLMVDCSLSLLLLLIGLIWLERSDPWTPKARGAAAGAAAGAWAALAMAVQCPTSDPIHVLGTHIAPVASLIVLGAWLGGRRTFRYRG